MDSSESELGSSDYENANQQTRKSLYHTYSHSMYDKDEYALAIRKSYEEDLNEFCESFVYFV